jgi:hypothetical protein
VDKATNIVTDPLAQCPVFLHLESLAFEHNIEGDVSSIQLKMVTNFQLITFESTLNSSESGGWF